MRGAPMRGAVASKVGAASLGVASGSRARAASLLKTRIGSCGAGAAVPAQPALALAKTAKATNEMARSWLMATEQSRRPDFRWPNLSPLT